MSIGGLGGLFSSVINPASLVMMATPAGWASLAVKTLVSAIGEQLIQQLGQQLGLPQSMIDVAQGAFAGAMGDTAGVQRNLEEAVQAFTEGMGFSPAQQGEFQRDLNDQLTQTALEGARQAEKSTRGGGKGGEGWLQAIAEALGGTLNEMAEDMSAMAEDITKDTPDLTTKFSALSQQFSILFNAASTAIKAIGEGMSSTARKQ
ncbi:hypothetical protein FHS96_000561 [Sphingomonas zeicaulis]|uniref:hypothetical protein n=1 Tax=Sphingomonas zeicaulis TaxID=1632740 RepID=UPI003D1ABA8E